MSWAKTTMVSIDTETTGLDWTEDRIIQLGASIFINGKFQMGYEWNLNAGYPSNPEAVAVHGITDEMQRKGLAPFPKLWEISKWINVMRCRNAPVIIMNAPFDLNFLISEWKRWRIPFNLEGSRFFDPLVVDRFYSKNRIPSMKHGARTLKVLSERYGIHDYPLHSAGHDSRRVGELAIEMINRHGQIMRATPKQLHDKQVKWHKQWCDDFSDYAGRKGFQFQATEWPHRPISADDQEQQESLAYPE